jgi:hypothetical protein
MATANILYVGTNICHRIPIMESAGLTVCQSEDSIPAIRNAFAHGESFSVITFHTDVSALPWGVVSVTRTLSVAPLVLFENPYIYCEKSNFDLVVPAFSSPSCWLKKLHDVIEASRKLQEYSQQLLQDYARVKSTFLETSAESAHVRVNPLDLEAIWSNEEDEPS